MQAVHPWQESRPDTLPDPELEISGGDMLSPLDWLRVGMDPAPVVALARDL